MHLALMLEGWAERLARGSLPEPGGFVGHSRQDGLAIGTEATHSTLRSCGHGLAKAFPRRHLPQAGIHSGFPSLRLAVGAERRIDRPCVSSERRCLPVAASRSWISSASPANGLSCRRG